MQKRYLMAPGPVAVSPEVLAKMSEPIIHHRSPQFSAILQRIREDLKYLFQTQNDVIMFASSGTGGMEASVVNLLSPGDTAIVIRAGKFGERWTELCESYGIKAVNIDVPWGDAADIAIVEQTLNAFPEAKAVLMQAHETSTGAKQPVKEIAALLKNRENTVLAVDAITALGVYELKTDEWGLDVVVTGSQKALALPPGLALVSVSEKAMNLAKKATSPRYYFNFLTEKKAVAKQTTAFTPAVSLIMGLGVVLEDIKKTGLEAVFAHHARLAAGTREAIAALGLELYTRVPSEAVTVVKTPDGIDGQALVKKLREEYGITIAGGQGQAKGKIFRISHMGHLSEWDMIIAIAAVERGLRSLGASLELGKGVAAAQRYFAANQ